MPEWVPVVSAFVLGGTGVAGVLGVIVNWRSNRALHKAKGVDQAIDGLDRLTQRQRAELDAKDRRIAELEAALADALGGKPGRQK